MSNVTTNNTASTWTDAIYLSTNNFWDITAALVADVNHAGLAANSSYNSSWTGPLLALSPGAYYAIFRADVRNTVPELNLSNNVVVSPNTIATDVPILPLGHPVTNQLTTGSAQYYKITAAPGQTVQINLTGGSTSSFNQLFVRYGAMPDLGNFDFLYSNPLSPNQQIVIPATQKGWYYIMVRGENEPGGPLGYALEADIVPFAITSVSQNHIGDNGQVTITLTGAQFQPGASVELVSGTNTYSAQTTFFNDATSVAARFLFTNAVHGIYDLVLNNPNNQSTTATQALTIETATPLTAQVIPGSINNYPRVGLPFEWTGSVINIGNVDIEFLTVGITLDQPFNITLNPPSVAVLALTNSTENTAGGCAFMARDLPPGESFAFSFAVSGFGLQTFHYYVVPIVQTKQSYTSQVVAEAQAIRAYVLAATNGLTLTATNKNGIITTNIVIIPPEMATALATTNTWLSFVASGFLTSNMLDTNDFVSRLSRIDSKASLVSSPVAKDDSVVCALCDIAFAVGVSADITGQTIAIAECILTGPLTPACIAEVLELSLLVEVDLEAAHKNCLCAAHCSSAENCGGGGNGGGSSGNDPNYMQGPPGYSTAAFVGSQVPWQYTIYVENESNALAFARQIAITNALNPSFDVRTFRVSEIVFGNVTISVPANRSFYQTRVAAPYPNPTNIVVDVTAGVDVEHSIVFWTLNAIDLNTGQLVESAFEGVLPPDTTNNIGDGHVVYTIQPATGVPTGTVITNDAAVVFDINDPIITNTTTNTVERRAPNQFGLCPAPGGVDDEFHG